MNAIPATTWTPLALPRLALPNRIVRSATYEGLADLDGAPAPELASRYSRLANGGTGTIVTGFLYVSPEGRAMQPHQAGMEADYRIAQWRAIVAAFRAETPRVCLVAQLAHAGRQTRSEATNCQVVGASTRPCRYFREPVHALDEREIQSIIASFAQAATRAKAAGFDAVQLHAAHGYLLHQFLSPSTNRRVDPWRDGVRLLEAIVEATRQACGPAFPILVKLSWAEDATPGIRLTETVRTVKRLQEAGVDAVEISYGTMEVPFNIFRGDHPIRAAMAINPMFRDRPPIQRLIARAVVWSLARRCKPFKTNYNMAAAAKIKRETGLAVVVVGGIRTPDNVHDCLIANGLDAVALCRPLIRNPELPDAWRKGNPTASSCTNCNLCAIHCDSPRPTQCHHPRKDPVAP